MKKVFMAGGGTGGHFFPAYALAEYFYNHGFDITFFGSKHGIEARLDFPFGDKILYDIGGVIGKGFKTKIKNLEKIFLTALKIKKYIERDKPDFIITFGGYASAPLGLASKLSKYRVPLYIHEQNSIPSKTNKVLSFFARKIFVSFEYTLDFFPKKKTILAGMPLRSVVKKDKYISKELARKLLGVPIEATIVLIMGGSQGAKKLNEVGLELARKRKDLFFILITGKNFYEIVPELNVKKFLFYERVGLLYRSADFIISRAGASTVHEVMYYGIPPIFVPYPYAVENHQYYNVKWLADLGLAQVILDKEFNVKTASEALDNYLNHPNINELSKKLESYFINESESRIYDEILADWYKSLEV
jgi:UDP-N-acetylglucosamine--N-acetylmuramyl-(pentapeptide) pyrophosphoryl-undecaprenol N-acetylglucosamine transferase